MSSFNHLVCVNENSRELEIFRVDDNGIQTLFTKVSLPQSSGWTSETERLAKQLGENLLIDSPVARRLLGI
jgi:hypothetical protein